MQIFNFPSKDGSPSVLQLDFDKSLVLIGANGCGKSRLGVYIEKNFSDPQLVHRISAQRALSIPDFAPFLNLEQAEKKLFIGDFNPQYGIAYKEHFRWGRDPYNHILNDYSDVLSVLFAKDHEINLNFKLKMQQEKVYSEPEETPIEKIIMLWKKLFPHREINFRDGKVEAWGTNGEKYSGKNLSDGERVIIYMAAQCFCAKPNSLIIIDEPEIHVHKSLMYQFWDRVEEMCSEICFVYITHDLDFASSRKAAKKLWIKSHMPPNSWEWQEIDVSIDIPEKLFFEILGSRKKVLFCEGLSQSLDTRLYKEFYSDFFVVPREGCDNVINSFKALQENSRLHGLEVKAIIDSDYRPQDEISALTTRGVSVLPVAEIENIFCIEELISIIAIHLGKEPGEAIKEAQSFVFVEMGKEIEFQAASMAERKIRHLLLAYTKQGNTEDDLRNSLNDLLRSINITNIYNESYQLYTDTIARRDYLSALRIYNRKSIADRVSRVFNLKDGGYVDLIFKLMATKKRAEIMRAFGTILPKL